MQNGARFRRAALIVNTRSRSGREAYREARRRLESLGVPLEESFALKDPVRLPEAVKATIDDGHDLIVLGGGDGTVSSVVDFMARGEATFGLLPLGTANDFARTLGIPTDLRRACETVARGKVVDVDLGLADDNYYVNVASVGLSAGVTRALSPALKRRAGALAYPIAAVRAFLAHEPFSATLTFPEGDHEPAAFDRLLQVAVGNGRFYGGGLVVAPAAGIDDGRLDVYAIRPDGRRELAGVLRYLRTGEFVRRDCVSHYETRRVRLETEPHLPVNIDGELVAETPVEFSVVPNALRVLVPPDSTAARRDLNV
ncbi:lipid kinase [Rubrobacter taiwanensis]|jgi:diacylglycerol kinase (ATP)|uniref:Lipid kinase n=1 Tax=Rubrobacter taiwanensis TaxID=185139 RepID=A0A4R1BCW4_9ACTN|nr:lipid kinase [Rubrobacter taiwanensis]TCJ14864.1 lipid kinase [Rubrobacter taiwanensis]